MFPKSTHETFANKLYQTFKTNKRFIKPKLSRTDFTVSHYAGEVCYLLTILQHKKACIFYISFLLVFCPFYCGIVPFQVQYQSDQFLDKNKDYVIAEHQDLLGASKCPFVVGLFPKLEETSKSSKFSSIGSRVKVKNIKIFC